MASTDGERVIELRFASKAERLKLVRTAVAQAATASGCSAECVRDIVMAVDEACQNVIRHGYCGNPEGEIILDVRHTSTDVVIDLMDFAPPVDEKTVKPRPLDEIRPGGLGTHFIRECMDEVGFHPSPSGTGNHFRMTKRIF